MTVKYKGKTYKATYNGVEYEGTIRWWIDFLADKPIFKHSNYSAIRQMFCRQKQTHNTNEQCLGIVEPIDKRQNNVKPQNNVPLVPKNEMQTLIFRQRFLSTALL